MHPQHQTAFQPMLRVLTIFLKEMASPSLSANSIELDGPT
jgi:hypothetical protein